MTNLDLAIVHYLDTEADLGAAATASADAMRTHCTQQTRSTYRAWEKAIDAATSARSAHRRARDQLVHAALATRHQETP